MRVGGRVYRFALCATAPNSPRRLRQASPLIILPPKFLWIIRSSRVCRRTVCAKKHLTSVAPEPPANPWQPVKVERKGSRVECRNSKAAPSEPWRWAIKIETDGILPYSHWPVRDSPQPLALDEDAGLSHVKRLGLMETNGSIRLPAFMPLPGRGTFQVSASLEHEGPLSCATTQRNTKIIFPAATREHPALLFSESGLRPSNTGGTTACFAFYTLAPLYDPGRIKDGIRTLSPIQMLIAKGNLPSFGDNRRSRDRKTRDGKRHVTKDSSTIISTLCWRC